MVQGLFRVTRRGAYGVEIMTSASGRKTEEEGKPDRDAQAGAEAANEGRSGRKRDAKHSARKEAAAESDRLLRLQADFENFRKRTIREKEDIYKRANEDLMNELLPVLDHIDLAFAAVEDHDAHSPFVDGFRLVTEQLGSVLGRFGLGVLDATEGQFDPHSHEAISHIESDSVPENHIVAQTRRGYKLGDRLLRPAQVVVSKGASVAPASEAREEE